MSWFGSGASMEDVSNRLQRQQMAGGGEGEEVSEQPVSGVVVAPGVRFSDKLWARLGGQLQDSEQQKRREVGQRISPPPRPPFHPKPRPRLALSLIPCPSPPAEAVKCNSLPRNPCVALRQHLPPRCRVEAEVPSFPPSLPSPLPESTHQPQTHASHIPLTLRPPPSAVPPRPTAAQCPTHMPPPTAPPFPRYEGQPPRPAHHSTRS